MSIIITAGAAFCVSFILFPLLLSICKKQKWFDTINSRKIHDGNVPRLGSIGFVPVFLIASIPMLFLASRGFVNAESTQPHIKITPIFVPAFLIFLFGIIDDFKELRARSKFFMQVVVSAVPVVCGLYFRQLGPLQLGWFGPLFTFIYLLGFINAFNLIDGIDALCASISLGTALSLGAIYAFAGSREQCAVMFILAATLCAFLCYNKPKAKIFMGDGGSQFLGFIFAAFPLIPSAAHIEYNKLPLMLVLAATPVLDTVAAIWRRTREKRMFYTPDTGHIHHKFLNMGYTNKSILFFLLIIQFGICVIAISAVSFIQYFRGLFVLCAVFAAMCLFFAIIHYTHRAVNSVKSDTTGIQK